MVITTSKMVVTKLVAIGVRLFDLDRVMSQDDERDGYVTELIGTALSGIFPLASTRDSCIII